MPKPPPTPADYQRLIDVLKKMNYAPATGYGETHLELEVDIDWTCHDIKMVKVMTKNIPPKEDK